MATLAVYTVRVRGAIELARLLALGSGDGRNWSLAFALLMRPYVPRLAQRLPAPQRRIGSHRYPSATKLTE